jgi:hypothetical protein
VGATKEKHTHTHTLTPSPLLQHYGLHVYASLHARTVTAGTIGNYAQDGCTPVAIPAGWHVAPPDVEAMHVCGAYPWQSDWLVFSDGVTVAGTSICHTQEARGGRRRLCEEGGD